MSLLFLTSHYGSDNSNSQARSEEMALALFFIRRNQRRNRQERIYNVRRDAFELTDRRFRARFRLPIVLAQQLIADLDVQLGPTKRTSSISNGAKVLAALRFYARGSHQLDVAENEFLGMSQPSISNAINEVSKAICRVLVRRWIKRPSTEAEKMATKRRFLDAHGFPGVVGAIDCTHVAIIAPPVNHPDYQEHQFINRKLYHSLNVQLVCNMDEMITNANAKFPGRNHDQHIFRSSRISRNLERENDKSSWLIGDGGYMQEAYMMVPIANAAAGSPEERYNRRHAKARAVIERCNGLLKARWRCLLKSRTLHYSPPKAARIVMSCVVLHNMCIHHRLPLEQDDDEDDDLGDLGMEDMADNLPEGRGRGQQTTGQRHRARLVQRHFAV